MGVRVSLSGRMRAAGMVSGSTFALGGFGLAF